MTGYRRKIAPFALLAAAVLAASGCRSNSNPVLAKAGSAKITQEDFDKEVANSPSVYQNYLGTMEGKKQFLDILLKEKILLNAAEKSDVPKKADFKKSIEDYDKRLKDQAAEYRKGLLLREYLSELKDGDLKVTDAEIKNYYEQNKDVFQHPRKIVARHILCLTEADAQEALRRVKRGENFAKVAKEMSKDPTAERGGLIGEVTQGDLADLPEFEDELFKLRPGRISGIVKTKLGYHIIRDDSETRMRGQSLDEATPHIRRILEKQKFDAWIDKAKKDQKVWINDKALASLPVPPPASEEPESLTPQKTVR